MEKTPVYSLNGEINEYTVNKTQGKPWLLVLLSMLSRQIQCYLNNKKEKTHERVLRHLRKWMSTTVLHMAELGSMTESYNNIEESQWCTGSVKLLVAQSCPTLCNLMDYKPARLLCPWNSPSNNTGVGCLFPSPGDLPDPGMEPGSPALAGFFTTESPGKPDIWFYINVTDLYRLLYAILASSFFFFQLTLFFLIEG